MIRKAVILSTVLFIGCVPACALALEKEWAQKMFNSLEYDFGDLARGVKPEHRFKITNIFEEDIHIRSVRSSCGCTSPRLTKQVLRKGESCDLIAAFNTIGFNGSHSATITVSFGQPFPAEVRLKVKGFVRTDVVFQPGRIDFGSIPAGTGAQKNVTVTYAGQSDWRIVDVRSSNLNYEIGLKELTRNGGRVQYEIQFQLKKATPPGYINQPLTLVTNDAQRQHIQLPVEGRVIPSLSVSPSSLHLGVVKPGGSVTKQLVVRGTTPFRVASVVCEEGNDCFEFELGDEERKLHLIPMTFTASDNPGKIDGKIRITTEGAEGTVLEVPVQVEVRDE